MNNAMIVSSYLLSPMSVSKRAAMPITALISAPVFSIVDINSTVKLIVLVGVVPLVLFRLYDLLQRRSTFFSNYPIAARLRWFFYDLGPFLRAYIVENDQEAKPFSLEARELVYARANGAIGAHPFGTELDTDSFEYECISHSMVPESEPETSPRVVIGGPQCSRPYSALIFNISAMSFGSISAAAVRALNKGAKLGNFYQDTGEGDVSRYHFECGGDWIWELGSVYFGCRDNIAGARAARLHQKILEALADVVAAASFKHPKDLQPHPLDYRITATEAHSIDQIWPFLPEKDIAGVALYASKALSNGRRNELTVFLKNNFWRLIVSVKGFNNHQIG